MLTIVRYKNIEKLKKHTGKHYNILVYTTKPKENIKMH